MGQPEEQSGNGYSKYIFWPVEPPERKSFGHIGSPRNISSLKYKNLSDNPLIRCKLASIAALLNVGRWLLSANISSCVTRVILENLQKFIDY